MSLLPKPRKIVTSFSAIIFYLIISGTAGNCLQADLPVVSTTHLFDMTGDFKYPSDIEIAPDGKVYLLDGVNNKVQVFSSQGEPLFSFGSKGKGNGKLNFPLGLEIDQNGTVYVADSGNQLIQVFSGDGKFQYQFPIKLEKSIKPPDPTDVVVDLQRDRCYVIDNDNHIILVYSLDGTKLLDRWGSKGLEKGALYNPFLATLGSDANLYVVEVFNTRVQAFTPEGEVHSLIGGWGVDRGQFYRPKGIALDRNDRVYVSDSYLGVIQIFDKNGDFEAVLGNPTNGILRLQTPFGLAVDDHLRLFVVEMTQNRVRVFQLAK